MKIAVYTAIFGRKDLLHDPIGYIEDDNIDYFVISESEVNSKIYQLVRKEIVYSDITKNARYYKLFGLKSFSSYDYVIWHDANLQIRHTYVRTLIKTLNGKSISTFKHLIRSCVYEEAMACISYKKDDPIKIFRQILNYFLNGLPANNGLYGTAILVKDNSKDWHKWTESWWKEIAKFTRRDQISLAYVQYKKGISLSVIEGSREANPYAEFHKHSHSEYITLNEKEPTEVSYKKKAIYRNLVLLLKKLARNAESTQENK